MSRFVVDKVYVHSKKINLYYYYYYINYHQAHLMQSNVM